MSNVYKLKEFRHWIQAFEYWLLQNENDVKDLLILPLFQYLGYPDRCRRENYRSQFNIDEYLQDTEIEYIYFNTNDIAYQNENSSLVIVATEHPNNQRFNAAIEKSQVYLTSIKPLFLMMTNGYHLKVFQCLRYRREELIFDLTIESFRNSEIAADFYDKLNFSSIKNIKKNADNNFNHPNYIFLEKSLRRYPKLQSLLETSDFKPTTWQEDNRLVVIKPKVLIDCQLPQAFGEGNCVIEFSSNILRGLKIHLSHEEILSSLMVGLKTRPEWGCRYFIQPLDENTFAATLGQTSLVISELEATDLCLCVDAICHQYQKSMIEAENSLETWAFPLMKFDHVRGLHLFSIEQRLWELMQNFAHEFNYAQGKSEWHIFNEEGHSIRISRGIHDHAFILPKASSSLSLLPHSRIHILYAINDVHLKSLERGKVNSWQQNIGSRGTWTAKYTQHWLLEKFIPYVVNYYSQQLQVSEVELLAKIINLHVERQPITNIDQIRDFLPYLRDIQDWLNHSRKNIASFLLRGYYQAFIELVRNTDASILGIDYINGILQTIAWNNIQVPGVIVDSNFQPGNFKDAWNYLHAQFIKIKNYQYESSYQADLMTRIFIWLIDYGKINYSQVQLNHAKQALLPLWELSRFEMRHVYSYR
ncbi:hypothetical protein B6N60_01645 [Richelia sinica FACHB-800]|uniref:Type I restriction enzyme R protein N-terminal domain-containing protein n=1 Tax=Richelia sinica FACHB-800 TaxID=1357546 RepID=A0A975T7P1_9NOST|nr:hypothetical protein [Richelia sinica]MBD2666338.1 hypothetical protein [Richelia sinica FACHB-800]QXE22958.1 hypothetical protein B6N60_01645 [Richelia sinica FACHB-800]